MLVMGHPQFETQDDTGVGHGIPPIAEWQLCSAVLLDSDLSEFSSMLEADYAVMNVFVRLRNVFQQARMIPLPSTRLHDLTCFVVHRLVLSASDTASLQSSPITEGIRHAIILYMFIIQGPTYFSHAVIFNTIVTKFKDLLQRLESTPHPPDRPHFIFPNHELLDIWLLAIGMVAAAGTTHYEWFTERAQTAATSRQLSDWNEALFRIKSVLWLETPRGESIFRPHWDSILDDARPQAPCLTLCIPPSSTT